MRKLITSRARILMVVLGAATAVAIAVAVAVDEGEIVVLETTDGSGRTYETQLWVADLGGVPYLRAGRSDAEWLARLRAHPHVLLEREGAARAYRALPQEVEGVKSRLNREMAQKYGFADEVVGRFIDRRVSIPIRLQPEAAGADVPGFASRDEATP